MNKQLSNGNGEFPTLSKEFEDQYRNEGKWPPPIGLVVFNEKEPSTKGIWILLRKLSLIVRPSQRKYVDINPHVT